MMPPIARPPRGAKPRRLLAKANRPKRSVSRATPSPRPPTICKAMHYARDSVRRLATIAPRLPITTECSSSIRRRAEAFDQRGSERFMLGQIAESIADFDRYLQLRPDQEPWHWKRGISYYYAGRYDEGRRQFEGYQTVDDNDVENAVWRYLCMARSAGRCRRRATGCSRSRRTRACR